MDLKGLFMLNMKNWRKNRGLSQKKLSERCNAAHTYIRQIESGRRTPSFAFIEKLADALEIEAYQLFFNESELQQKDPMQIIRLDYIKNEILTSVSNGLDKIIDEVKR